MDQKMYLITGLMASGKSTVSELLASSLEKCVHLRGDVFRKMIVSGREDMSDPPSEEAVRQLHLRYRLTADAAKMYFDSGFSVVIQDNYYGGELNRMLEYLQGYPVETWFSARMWKPSGKENCTGEKQAIPALMWKPCTICLWRQRRRPASGWTAQTRRRSRRLRPSWAGNKTAVSL